MHIPLSHTCVALITLLMPCVHQASGAGVIKFWGPSKQGGLPLTFCFYQPSTACNIQLSIHSIVDSEEVEYMYHSEDCDCNVQILDRDQHGGGKMRDRHGVVRIKEPPLLRYTAPLANTRYHKLEKQFIKLFLSPDYKQMQQLSKRILDEISISTDIKVLHCARNLCLWLFMKTLNKLNNCSELLGRKHHH